MEDGYGAFCRRLASGSAGKPPTREHKDSRNVRGSEGCVSGRLGRNTPFFDRKRKSDFLEVFRRLVRVPPTTHPCAGSKYKPPIEKVLCPCQSVEPLEPRVAVQKQVLPYEKLCLRKFNSCLVWICAPIIEARGGEEAVCAVI